MKEVVIFVTLSVVLPACGVAALEVDAPPGVDGQAIVGGAAYSGLPAVGALFNNGSPWCTGTLVGPKKVLTAAHCLRGVNAARLQFRLGANAYTPAHVIGVGRVKPHPEFDPHALTHDIGVVTLKTSAPVAPMTLLAEMDDSWVGTSLFIVGYGVTNGRIQDGAGKKRAVTIPITAVDDTTFQYAAPGKNACNGDSGGPALYRDPNGTFLVAGVTSYGDAGCRLYGVDTRVDAFIDFVGAATALPSDPCRGETFRGRCAGDLLVWCEEEEVKSLDCTTEDSGCAWDAPDGFYNCL
jgi:secreted trypsin-like serine protease